MAPVLSWTDLVLEKPIGEGHTATVWLARIRRSFANLPKDAFVAVKRYKLWILREPGQRERIHRQMELSARLDHPHLIKAIALVRDPSGRLAVVMEYLPNETLEARLNALRKASQVMPLDVGMKIIGELADSVAALHAAGFVHRDIKPANVLLTPSGAILADLGVVSSQALMTATTSGQFLGTIRYAAPEYLFGSAYDHRVDLYSLGAVAYEVLLGAQFYGQFQNWADLVGQRHMDASANAAQFTYTTRRNGRLMRANTIGTLSDIDSAAPYERLARQNSLNDVEAVRFVLTTTLVGVDGRIFDAASFAGAARSQFWKRAFFTFYGNVVMDEPLLPALDSRYDDAPTLKPSEVAVLLRKRLRTPTIIAMVGHLTRDYWRGVTKNANARVEKTFRALEKVGAVDGATDPEMERAGSLSGYGLDLPIEEWHYRDAVLAAYRYGYFDSYARRSRRRSAT
jgi:serine/threonine protein kinase